MCIYVWLNLNWQYGKYSITLWTERVTSVFTFGLSRESEICFNI